MTRSLRGGRLAIVLVVVLGVALILARVMVSLYVDVLWFREMGFVPLFWRRAVWGWGIRLGAGLVVASVLYFNLRYAARTLSGIQIKRRFGNLEISEQLPRSYVQWALLGMGGLLGLWFGASVPSDLGVHVLLASQRTPWGLVEPVFGRDVSFYVFVLPLLQTAVVFLLILAFLTFSVCTAAYAATGTLRWGRGGVVMAPQARVHLGAVMASFLLLVAAHFWLGRYLLLSSGNSEVQGIFGYADAHARIPGLQVLTWISVAGALLLFWGAWKNRLVPAVSAVVGVVVATLVLGEFYPAFVQRVRVQPNELERETPWIEENLAFTRTGFGLTDMARRDFRVRSETEVDWPLAAAQFQGLPVWTADALLAFFRQEEARFRYYEFSSVDVDRYPTAEGRAVVAVSAREIDPAGIELQNWQNLHLRERYIAGAGAVAVNAAEATPEGRPPMYLQGIPPEFTNRVGAPEALRLPLPRIFVGSRPQRYAIVNASDSTFLVSGRGGGVGDSLDATPDSIGGVPGVDFPEGVRLDSFFRTLAFAWYFRDWKLLFAREVGPSSRFVFRRQVTERVRRIAPFLRYPEAPYPVIHDGHLVWILEGFTSTRAFPLSTAYGLSFRDRSTWVRNSVKITVDALSGAVRFYALPGSDPLLDAYGRAFPGLLQPFQSMPEGLRRHVRYAREMLNLQARVLRLYHQRTAAVFHGQQDVWELPQELFQNASAVPYRAEYGLYRFPGEDRERFQLTTVFVPQGRQNLTGILAGTLGAEGRPSLTLLDVPVEDQVRGPRQIESLVEQDPLISQQFSLWRTGGSQVWTGHLHLVPVGDRLLYMEPVYIAAEADAIPQIQAFVVSEGQRVAMESTLREAVEVLAGERVATEVEPRGPSGAAGEMPDSALDMADWPADALEVLDRAEERLRRGDWQGFGAALEQLRTMLQRLSGGG